MKRFSAIAAVLVVVCSINAFAQAVPLEHEENDSTSIMAVHTPRTEEVTGEGDIDVRVRGSYPYVWFEPTGSAATNGWFSCFIQLNVTATGGADGNYFAFLLNDNGATTKQFLFNKNVVLRETAKLGIGTVSALPQYDLEINKTDPTTVSGMIRNQSSAGSAALQIQAGSGTASSMQAYTRYSAATTAAPAWSTGIVGGNGEYRIKDKDGYDRMTISVPDANHNATITFNGTVEGGIIHAQFQDIAEWVPTPTPLPPGTVVILDPDHVNQVIPSKTAYDTTVAGVVSTQPGIVLGLGAETKVRVATMGRVRVNVDASRGPIRIGDLLVTSNTPGTAMKSEALEHGNGVKDHRVGTIVGKALEPLQSGTGQILALLTLQ